MDIRFYDSEFNLIYIESAFKSVNWDIPLNGIGTFEMYVCPDSKLVDIAVEREFIIAVQGDRQAIITTKHFEDDRLLLYGRTCNFLLSKKVVFPFSPDSFENKDASCMVKELVLQYFGEAQVKGDTENSGESTYYTETPCTLFEAVSGILEEKGLGHRLYFDIKNRKWIFEIIKGEERGLIFSESLLNMYAFERDDSILDMASGGYYYQPVTYMGVWYPSDNIPPLTVSPENYGKSYHVYETCSAFGMRIPGASLIVCKNIDGSFEIAETQEEGFYKYIGEENEGISHFECFLDADNYEDAVKELKKRKKETNITAKVKNVKFGTDYFLGDVVKINKRIKGAVISQKMKITGINIWQENANEGEMPVFSEYKEEA